ncbi:VanZ family protein [bacterium]|jgi:VanZ family protein|nr:VanZ family protein [bacterium]NBO36371.1 VanZ family protein [bacterium]
MKRRLTILNLKKFDWESLLNKIEKHLPLFLICIFIFIQSDKTARVVSYDGNTNWFIHKLAHFVLFSLVFLFANRSFGDKRKALVFTILYGISDEIHQSFVPTRTASLTDVLIDSSAGVSMYILISKYKKYLPISIIKFFNI